MSYLDEGTGDWGIYETTSSKDDLISYVVRGWGIEWYCESIEKARKVAELLDQATSLVIDMAMV